MAAQIMADGDSESSVFSPRGSFMLTVRATSGTIAGDWFLYYTTDPSRDDADWQQAHATAFSETSYNDVFDFGEGFYCKLRGGTGTNIEAHFAHLVGIPQDKFDDRAAVLA